MNEKLEELVKNMAVVTIGISRFSVTIGDNPPAYECRPETG
jgi:hypothetical protein